MKERQRVKDLYNKVIPAIENLKTKEYNNSVLVMKVKYHRATGDSKLELEENLLERSQAFEDFLGKLYEALEDFKKGSKEMAQLEQVPFNEKFNKYQYINYIQFVKQSTIKNKSINGYLDEATSMLG